MPTELLDYSYDRLTPAQIRAAGRAGVIRYVASGRPAVSASRAEVDGYRAAGLTFTAVWQNGKDRALTGRAGGLVDAADAYRYCAGLAAGAADPVYFAVDFDAQPAHMDAVADYIRGAADVLGWHRTGAYGGAPVLEHLRAATPLGLFWQTVAWSGGVVLPYANLLQYAHDQLLAGARVDYDRALTTDYGQWGTHMPTTYPGCRWTPLGAQTENRQTTHNVIILHTMVGYLVSTDGLFRAGNGAGFIGLESHFGVGGQWGPDLGGGYDGAVWQWQDLDYQAQASGEGNWRAISVETADNAPQRPEDIAAWTARQVDALVGLCVWLCRRYGIPARLVPDTRPGSSGIGWHAQGCTAVLPAGAERWSPTVGKPCPTARRIAQIRDVIVPRVRAALAGEPEEDMPMTPADADLFWNKTVFKWPPDGSPSAGKPYSAAAYVVGARVDAMGAEEKAAAAVVKAAAAVAAVERMSQTVATQSGVINSLAGQVAELTDRASAAVAKLAQLAEASGGGAGPVAGDVEVSGVVHLGAVPSGP